MVVRKRLPDAQGERAVLGQPLPETGSAEPAILVVDGGHAPRRDDPQALAHRVDELVVRRGQVPVSEPPRGLLAQNARRLAVLVELDHASSHLEVPVRGGKPGRVQPERVVVARHESHRRVTGHRVERLPGRLDLGRPVAAAPAPAAEPPSGLQLADGAFDQRERLVQRRRVLEPHLSLGERPGRKVDVRVAEPRQDAATAEVDVIGRGERLLVRPDAAGDPIPGDRQSQHHGHRRVHRADHAVLEDHNSKNVIHA